MRVNEIMEAVRALSDEERAQVKALLNSLPSALETQPTYRGRERAWMDEHHSEYMGRWVAVAGGGFDFLCGLPIALELERRGHAVHIVSYSFTDLSMVASTRQHSEHLLEITADTLR